MDLTHPENPMTKSLLLNHQWLLAKTNPNAVETPSDLDSFSLDWNEAIVPGTVAQSTQGLHDHNNLDDFDWWYRCSFDQQHLSDESAHLVLEGLSTIADVWLNNELILQSNNMFVCHKVDISQLLKQENQLCICFRSLSSFLAIKRPRPKWKTNLVNHQQLRWARTTLLGRIPGWTPAISPIGPWKNILLQRSSEFELKSSKINTTVAGENGIVDSQFTIENLPGGRKINGATLEIGQFQFPLELTSNAQEKDCINLHGGGEAVSAPLWLPHTHGKPNLLSCRLIIHSVEGDSNIELGKIAFKQVQLLQNNDTRFIINGIDVFCRGACWTITDFVSLVGDEKKLRQSLLLAKEAGINMLRIGGTMVYESDAFL